MMRVHYQEASTTLSDRARKAFQLAHQEAHRLNHPAVGPEHLLLGLVKEGQSRAAAVLRQLGFDLVWLRERIERLYPPTPDAIVRPGSLPYRDDLERFLADVIEAGECSGVLPLSPEYLLAALLTDSDGDATRLLHPQGLSLWRLRRELRHLT